MIKIKDFSTRSPKHFEKDEIKKWTVDIVEQIGELQNVLYAERKHSVLLILQGMDAAGKDGTTHAVFSGCSMTGVQAYSFKKPTEEEFAHDFLWRVHKQVPEKGIIKVFNRSHYEDILIQYVHGWIDDDKREKRMAAINAFEECLQNDSSTTVIKCFMHISPEEQLKKFEEQKSSPGEEWIRLASSDTIKRPLCVLRVKLVAKGAGWKVPLRNLQLPAFRLAGEG